MAQTTALGFAGLLRQLRAEAKLTQEELAQAAGLSPRSVSDLERGVNRTAHKDTAELLAGALGLAEPVRSVFVGTARGRIPAGDVLAALREAAEAAPDAAAGGDADGARTEREAFVAALHAAATVPVGPNKRPPALVIAVVRADFLGRLIAYPPLKEALDAVPFTTGPMSEAELRLAVTGPAAEAGLTVEPALGAAHQAARRSTRRRRSFAILAVLTVLAVVASVVALSQRAEAIRQRNQANYNQLIARALQSGASDTPLAAQLTLAAYRIQPTEDLASRLLNTENTHLATPLATGAGGVSSVAFGPGGQVLAEGNVDGTVRLWNVSDPTHPRPLGQPLTGSAAVGLVVDSVAFSPDGHTLASGSAGGTIQLWNLANPAQPQLLGPPLTGGSGPVNPVAFSPGGRTLAGGDNDGVIRLWNLNVQSAIDRICAASGGLTAQQWSEYVPQLGYQPSCGR